MNARQRKKIIKKYGTIMFSPPRVRIKSCEMLRMYANRHKKFHREIFKRIREDSERVMFGLVNIQPMTKKNDIEFDLNWEDNKK